MVAEGSLKGYEEFYLIAAMGTEPLTIHTRAPSASLADLKGKKIRASNRTEATVLKALGMEPVVIPINQAADSINSGAIEGSTTALETLADFGISRFATNHYMLGLGSVPLLIVMSRKKFDGLPPAAQDVIRKFSGTWSANHYLDSINAYGAQILGKLKSDPRRNVIYPSQQDLARARNVFDLVRAHWADGKPRNRALLDLVEAELAKLRLVG